jgi:hypothetical protein
VKIKEPRKQWELYRDICGEIYIYRKIYGEIYGEI